MPSPVVVPGPDAKPCHTQGLAVGPRRMFVSCVDNKARRAWVYRYDLPEGFPFSEVQLGAPTAVDLTRGSEYHPSGLDLDKECLWVAVAEYRQFSAHSTMICLDPETMTARSSFPVADHLGAVAVMGDELAAMNWDARQIYRFSREGKLLARDDSPSRAAYQDCQGISKSAALCSGPARRGGVSGAGVEMLIYDSTAIPAWRVEKKFFFAAPRVSLGREAFAVANEFWSFLPEDFPRARLFLYPAPPGLKP